MTAKAPRASSSEIDVLRPTPIDDPWPALGARDAVIDVFVMSKDRACQLDGLLRSMRAFVQVPLRVHVVYTTSSIEFERGYDLLRLWHPGVRWIDEGGSFRATFLGLLAEIGAGPGRYFMPLVDDMLFTRSFTAMPLIEQLESDEDLLAVALRLGENITFCHPRDAPTRPPAFRDGYRWEWKTAHAGYWNCPMSVDGNVYRTADFVDYIPKLGFHAAGTLEAVMAGRPFPGPLLACERYPCVVNFASRRSASRSRESSVGVSRGRCVESDTTRAISVSSTCWPDTRSSTCPRTTSST